MTDDPGENRILHLDSAACGRQATTTLDAVADHARLEVERGGYVAEELAAGTLDGLHRDLATLLGTDAEGVALLESASTARDALLRAWPLSDSATIGVLPSEWGPNLVAFEQAGLRLAWLDHDAVGRLDLDAFERRLTTDPPDVVHLTQVAAHSGLEQPVSRAVSIARECGVPVWVDAAQALGHVDCTAGADATYAVSRKWLTGPRGIGVLAVSASSRDHLRVRPEELESEEAHVAGRVGLASAVRDHIEREPATVTARLAECGRRVRHTMAETDGWEPVDVGPESTAIVALRPTGGQDVVKERARLLEEHAILTTAVLPWRAPEVGEPWLRLSPHVDLEDADLDRLVAAMPHA